MTTTRVFLSSTLPDVSLVQRLGKAELPDGVEVALATANENGPRGVKQVSLRTLEGCHAYLGLFGAKYGAGQALELRRAEERSIPRAILVSDEPLDKPLEHLVTQMQSKGVLIRRVKAQDDIGQIAEELLMALSSRALAANAPPPEPVKVAPTPEPVVVPETKPAAPVVAPEPAQDEPNPFVTTPSMQAFNPFTAEPTQVNVPLPPPPQTAPVAAEPPPAADPYRAPSSVEAKVETVAEPQITAPQIAGRARVVADLIKALKPKTRVLLRGADGVGKSVVAKAVSNALKPRFPDGLFWVEVGERGLVYTENQLAWADQQELSTEHNRATRQDLLKQWFGGKRALLVLDDAGDKDLWPFLSLFVEGAILITARELPRAFATENLQIIDVPPLSAEEGEEVARAIWPESDAAEARELSKAAGGMPLAIAITASDAKSQKLGARQAAAALEKERGDSRVEAAAKRALAHFSDGHRQVFGAAGALPVASFSAASVALTIDLPVDGANQILQELASRGLLLSLGDRRYHLPMALRALAKTMAPENAALKFAPYYREFAEANKDVGRRHLDLMEHEREGIMLSARAMSAKLKALPPRKKGGWFSSLFGKKAEKDERQETAEYLIDIATNATTFLNVRGYWSEWKELCQLGIEGALEIADVAKEAKFLIELASVCRLEHNPKDAKTYATDAAAKFETANDKPSKSQALHLLALITWEEKKPKEALDLLNQAIQNADKAVARTWERLREELENAIKTGK
jgi:hypothetical protein